MYYVQLPMVIAQLLQAPNPITIPSAIYYNAAYQKPNPMAGAPTPMVKDFEIAISLLQKTASRQSIRTVPTGLCL